MNIYSANNHPPGFYVYAWLRETSSRTAKAGTPYYIGKGKGRRAWKHGGPKNHNLIVMLETGLTELGALALERRYIRWFGKKSDKTGILINLTDGGDGISGTKRPDIRKIFLGKKRPKVTDEHRKNISKSKKGVPIGKQEIVECPHCLKQGGKNIMKRYHFGQCKIYKREYQD